MFSFCCQEQSDGHGASIPSEGELLQILRAQKLKVHGPNQSVDSVDSSNSFEAPEVFNSILLERTEVGDVLECLFSSQWGLIQRQQRCSNLECTVKSLKALCIESNKTDQCFHSKRGGTA